MSFGEKKKVADPTAKWSVTFMNEMSKSRGNNRAGDTFNKALFSLIKADIKEPNSTDNNNADKAPKTARVANNSTSKIGNSTNTPAPNPEVRADTPGDRRSRGLTRSFSLNEITAMLAQPVPEEDIREPESELSAGPIPDTAESIPSTSTAENSIPNTPSDTCQTGDTNTPSSTDQISDSGTIQSTPDSGTIQGTESTTVAPMNSNNDTKNTFDGSSLDTSSDTCQTADTTTPPISDEPVTPRVKVPPLPVTPRSPRTGRHRHTRSVGSNVLLDHVISPRSKNSNDAPTSPRDPVSPRSKNSTSPRDAPLSPRDQVSPRIKTNTSPREIVNTTGAVVGASATDANKSKDKNSSDKNASKDKKRTLKKRSSKRTRPPSTINSSTNNSTSEESSDSPRSIKASVPNKTRRVSNSVSQIGNFRRGSISSDTVPHHSPRARTLKHAPKIDAGTIDATTQKLNLDYMDDVLISIKEKLLFPSIKSDFTAEKLEQMPLSWVMQRMPLLRAKRDLAFKHHMHSKQSRGKTPSPVSRKDYLLSNMTRWSSSDINKIRPGPSQSQSLTNSPLKAVSNNNLRHVRTGSGPQRRVTSIQLTPASPRDNDPNKETKSSPKSGEELKK